MVTDFDFGVNSLEIKTHGDLQSDEGFLVEFLDPRGRISGGFLVKSTSSTQQYKILHCSTSLTDVPTSLSSDTVKTWRLTVVKPNREYHNWYVVRLVIHCNEVEVLNAWISSSTCDIDHSTFWEIWDAREKVKIKFQTHSSDGSAIQLPLCYRQGDLHSVIVPANTFKNLVREITRDNPRQDSICALPASENNASNNPPRRRTPPHDYGDTPPSYLKYGGAPHCTKIIALSTPG